jgi:hypothetical protein
MPKADRAMAVLSSLLVGDGVDAGRREKRAEICSRCQLVQVRTTRRGNTKNTRRAAVGRQRGYSGFSTRGHDRL